MRLTDVDAVIEKLKQHHDFFVKAYGGFAEMPIQDKARCDELSNSIAEIINAPSIDLVHCRECEKAHLTYDGECKYCDEWKDDDGNYIEVYHDGNHYCSYGVRRDNDD